MTRPRKKFEVSYRILDTSGRCLEVIKETGYNKNYIHWLVERRVQKKYGKGIKLHTMKIIEITD